MAEQKVAIRVYFADDSFKTLAVPTEITASELREVMAEKIELEAAGKPYFDLLFYKGGECRSIEPNEQICRLMVLETLSSASAISANDTTGSQALVSKNLNDRVEWEKLKKDWEKDQCKIVYQRRIMSRDRVVTSSSAANSNPVTIKYTFLQALSSVMNGTYPSTKQDALELAAYLMQMDFGDYNPKVHVLGFIIEKDKMSNLIPTHLLTSEVLMKPEDWEREIFSEYSKLIGWTKEEAKMGYLQRVRRWRYFGGSFWNVAYASREVWSSLIPDTLCLCVNSSGIDLLRLGTKQHIASFDYRDIRSWSHSKSTFSFTCHLIGAKFQFHTVQGRDIANSLAAHVETFKSEAKH